MDTVLVARNGRIDRIDEGAWRQAVASAITRMPERLAFMTPEHHRVRNAAVLGLPANGGKPLSIAQVAAAADVAEEAARRIAAELERNLFFVVRGGADQITWAYPVTADETAHRITFDWGESIFGA